MLLISLYTVFEKCISRLLQFYTETDRTATGVFYINMLLKISLYLNRSLFFKRRLQHRCFLVNIAKFLRTPFLQKASGRLLVNRSLLFQELVLQVLTFIIENCMNISFLKSIIAFHNVQGYHIYADRY